MFHNAQSTNGRLGAGNEVYWMAERGAKLKFCFLKALLTLVAHRRMLARTRGPR